MSADPISEVGEMIDAARALHRRADALWTAHPVSVLDPVRVLRDELEYQIGHLEEARDHLAAGG